jgi:hypothetical protein
MRSKFNHCAALRWWIFFVLICGAATTIYAQATTKNKSAEENMFTGTQQPDSGKFRIRPIRMNSPRDTLKTFLRLRDEPEQTLRSYRLNKSRELAEQTELIYDQLLALLDLSSVARALQASVNPPSTLVSGYMH